MNGTTTHRLEDRVARLLQCEAALDDVAVVLSQRDGIRTAEEVWRVQQVDVQCVAGDPLTAVEQLPQRRDLGRDLDAADLFDRLPCTRLIGDGADPADARGQVTHLGVLPSTKERLE